MTSSTLDRHQLAAEIKQEARRLGFDLVGIADASPSMYRQYFRDWLDAGRAGEMKYLERRFDERTDPARYVPGAKSVICVAMNYYVELKPAESNESGRIARYALGRDYHEHIKDKLHELADWIRKASPDATTCCSVDTAPVMEKELSARAGVGWIGKNTCLINPELGSWLLLGEVITTLDLPADQSGVDRCGTCRRCIDACPTQAITGPYQLDATQCISYLTIEHRGEIDPALKEKMGDWIFGCDICQEVCPFNNAPMATINPDLQPRIASGALNAEQVSNWDEMEYRESLRHSAMKRVKLPVLQRNARIVVENHQGR